MELNSQSTNYLNFVFRFDGISDENSELVYGRCTNVTYITTGSMLAGTWENSNSISFGPYVYDFVCTDPDNPYPSSFLDQIVQILREKRRQSIRLQNPQNFASRHIFDLRNAKAIAQCHTNLGRRQTFLGKFADVITYIFRFHLQP